MEWAKVRSCGIGMGPEDWCPRKKATGRHRGDALGEEDPVTMGAEIGAMRQRWKL